MMRWGVVFLSLLAAMAILAGCGGGASSSGTDSSGASSASSTAEESTGEEAGKGEGKEEGPAVNEEAASGKEGEEAGKEGEEGKAATPQAAFKQEVDLICKQVPANYTEILKSLEKKNGGKPLPKAEQNLKAAVPPLHTAIEEMEQLSAPSSEQGELEAFISALEAAAQGLEEKPTSPLSGKNSPFVEFQKVTGEYNLEYCPSL